ncbi:hypothetical protein Avbf_12337 [Armadillidium vulgare]|nr:hypothetical protein Avbf_12337 [Armadillidium vulgare]
MKKRIGIKIMLKNLTTFIATSLLIQVIILSDFTSSTVYNCNPKQDCASGYEGEKKCTSYNYEKVADFKDCSSFYKCSPGRIKVHHKCPSTTPYFDGSDCSKDKYDCCNCCDECTPYCDDDYLEVADPYDCRSFYLCLTAGFPSDEDRYTCNEGQYFDASLGRCEPEFEWNRCKPTCKEKNNNSTINN